MTQQVPGPEMTTGQKFYVREVLQGLWITLKHTVRNVLNADENFTIIDYPDVKKVMPERYKGAHRLTTRPDGKVKCVACMMCAQICPAKCITIEAGEDPDDPVEKYPVQFQIDMLRCIYCGFCVEACPKDAIRMDTGIYEINGFTRQDLIHDKAYMKDLKAGKKPLAEDWYREHPEDAPPGYDVKAPKLREGY